MNILDSIREHLAAFSLLDSIKSVELSRKKIMKWAAYTIYGVLAFSLFFTAKYYVLRTDELVREAVGNLDSVSLEFSYLEPRLFPPRVLLEYLRIYEKKTQKPILLLKETEINLSVLPLLVGKVRLSVISRMYGGMMEADVSTGSLFNTEWVNVDLFLDMIELEKVPQVKEYDRTFKGFATVNASLRGEWASPLGMEGKIGRAHV